MASVYGPLHIRSVDLRAVPVSGLEILPYEHFSLPWLPEPVFFSRATKSFVGQRSFTRAAKPWQKPETEREKPLVPRVTSAQLQGCKLDEFLRSGWHCLALPSYFPHDKLHHNCSDTSLRVAEVMIGAKVVCFVSRIWHQDSSPGSLAFPCLGNRAEISHMNPRGTQGKIGPGNRASRVNQADVKRPYERSLYENRSIKPLDWLQVRQRFYLYNTAAHQFVADN